MAQDGLLAMLSGLFGVLARLVAATGLYGVMSPARRAARLDPMRALRED